MKELLEEYVLEVRDLKQQIAILLRLINYDRHGEQVGEWDAIALKDLVDAKEAVVNITDGILYVTTQ